MNETGEEGVAREVLEEIGLQVAEAVNQFSLPSTYLDSGFLVHTLDLFFLCKVKDTSPMCIRDSLTGIPEIERISIFHALNSKAVSRKYAASIGKHYEELNLICLLYTSRCV